MPICHHDVMLTSPRFTMIVITTLLTGTLLQTGRRGGSYSKTPASRETSHGCLSGQGGKQIIMPSVYYKACPYPGYRGHRLFTAVFPGLLCTLRICLFWFGFAWFGVVFPVRRCWWKQFKLQTFCWQKFNMVTHFC